MTDTDPAYDALAERLTARGLDVTLLVATPAGARA